MAGERYQFEKAILKWDTLQEWEEFSLQSTEGYVAILHSLHKQKKRQSQHAKEMAAFEQEAEEISTGIGMMGGSALVMAGVNHPNLYYAFNDRECSDLILIGHGSFSGIIGDNGEIFGWNYVSGNANHLKRGSIVQRFCGHFGDDVSVPFGMFGVTDHRNVIAPVGEYFAPELKPSDEALLRPVAEQQRLDFDFVKANFKYWNEGDEFEVSGSMD